MASCAIISCPSRKTVDKKTSGITFHKFPKETTRRKSWVKFVNRGTWEPSYTSVICSKHFTAESFDRSSSLIVRLRQNAIPTMNKDLSVLMKKSCFVPTCLNSSENAPNKIFIFVPRDTTTRKYWFEAVGLKVVKTTKYCCEDHFNLKEDSVDFYFYKRTRKTPRIKSGIVPHLFLNVCNSNIFYTQLGETEENISSEDENERDFNIPPLMPADKESSTETAKTKTWEKPKIENVAEYFMETSDVQNVYVIVKSNCYYGKQPKANYIYSRNMIMIILVNQK